MKAAVNTMTKVDDKKNCKRQNPKEPKMFDREKRARRDRKKLKKGYISLLLRIMMLLAAGWVLFSKIYLVTQAPDNTMFPAIKAGDLLIGFRLQESFVKDDVVMYEFDDALRVGRVMGRATDVITLDDSGTLLVNGTAQSGEILYPSYAKEGITYPLKIPENYVFILGDYRTQAEDSRDFGCIPVENVKARVITILRRRTI